MMWTRRRTEHGLNFIVIVTNINNRNARRHKYGIRWAFTDLVEPRKTYIQVSNDL